MKDSHEKSHNQPKRTIEHQMLIGLYDEMQTYLEQDDDERNKKLLLDIFRNGITEGDIDKEKLRIERLQRTFLSGGEERMEVTDEVAERHIVGYRAQKFWRKGLGVARNASDIETWLSVIGERDFFEIKSGYEYRINGIFERDAVEKQRAFTAAYLSEKIVEAGNDEDYLAKMANRIVALNLKDETTNPEATVVATGIVYWARRTVDRYTSHIVTGENRATATELPSEIFLAREILRQNRIKNASKKKEITPSKGLASVEFIDVSMTTIGELRELQENLTGALALKDTKNKQRESLYYFAGANKLLYQTMVFLGTEKGGQNENAQKMAAFLFDRNRHSGRSITPSQSTLRVLENLITPVICRIEESELQPIKGDNIEDRFETVRRLFVFLYDEAVSMKNEDVVEVVEIVGDCALQLAGYGLGERRVETGGKTLHVSGTILQHEPGPRARKSAAHRAGKSGYGILS